MLTCSFEGEPFRRQESKGKKHKRKRGGELHSIDTHTHTTYTHTYKDMKILQKFIDKKC